METPISQKNYPISNIWLLKSLLYSYKIFLILFIFYLLKSFGYEKDTFNFYSIFLPAAVIFYFTFTVLSKINFHYLLENKFFITKQGILSKQQKHMPYGVIQNVLVKQDLFDKIFGLASLTIENAAQGAGSNTPEYTKVFGIKIRNQKKKMESVGFSQNKISIPGLKKEDAEKLKEIILEKIKQNPIDDRESGL